MADPLTVADGGVITLPPDMLQKLGLVVGQDVTIEPCDGGIRLYRHDRHRVAAIGLTRK